MDIIEASRTLPPKGTILRPPLDTRGRPVSSDQFELSRVLHGFKDDPTLTGYTSLGKDGVFRSLTADGQVVDAVPLTPRLIKALLDRMPYNSQYEIDFRGVDGTKTSSEKWFCPDEGIVLPARESVERRDVSEEQLEENRRMLEGRRMEAVKRPLCVRADHDLGIVEDE